MSRFPLVMSLLPLLLAVVLLGSSAAATAAPPARELLVLTAAPIQPGKFTVLEGIAEKAGWHVRSVYAESLSGEEGEGLFKGADFILLDIPYEPVMMMVEHKVGGQLAAAGLPWLKIYEKRHVAHGVAEADAAALWAYYANGGRRNFVRFFDYLSAMAVAGDRAGIAPPIVFPEQGIYHPAHDGIFTDSATYLSWKKAAPGVPVVGFAIHRNYLASDLTAFIDHMIGRIEALGAVPLAFYTQMEDAEAFTKFLARDGVTLADVLITSQIMLEPEPRRAEFTKLGIPVIQAMPFRRGDVAQWRRDPAGVHLMDVPFYLSQPEYAGVVDAMTTAAVESGSGQIVPIEEQVEAVVQKALRLARLRQQPNRAKRVAFFFWNYPPGETNLSASYLNVPQSLAATLAAMKTRGYEVRTPTAEALVPQLQRLLKPYYRGTGHEALLKDGLAARLPLARYRAWFDTLPEAARARIVERWGEPERSGMLQGKGKDAWFPVPRFEAGNVVIMPQPPRGDGGQDKERQLYHDTKAPVNHHYLAVYLWVREAFGADALVHYGTHGTQEWMPGKERGLWVFDDSLLPIGDIPVVYPYIVDDVGEAIQAKRRGRALIVSHQTPPFSPAGLHDELVDLHQLVHEWQGLTEGAVRDKTAAAILAAAKKLGHEKDLGITAAQAKADFPTFLGRLHDWLHEMARANQPQGMHTFGRSQPDELRLGTVMQMLGAAYEEASFRFSVAHPEFLACPAGATCKRARMAANEADESFTVDYRELHHSIPYLVLQRVLVEGVTLPDDADAGLLELIGKARTAYATLDAAPELDAFLDGLEGRHIPTGYGGDPIRHPDSLPTGRNLYSFDPTRVPTRAAWEAGQEAVDKLIAAYREKNGHDPQKLAFSLWSVETMRHFGVLEAQAFSALGVRPRWDQGGRIEGIELIPREELKRPRIDVVLSATGLYRDHFPNVMRWLAEAVVLAAGADEADNAVRRSSGVLRERLLGTGMTAQDAARWADVRIFSNESGAYGTGIEDAIAASDTWESDGKLADLYLSRLQYAYGADMKEWGQTLPGVNLYAENLKGVQAAALSRTSNLYGMLTTDDPFQYLGGIALAVRHLTGRNPELFISNLREEGDPRAETAARFLARELRTRQFHPGWIEGMQREGYSGTTEILDSINNFWGWQVTAPDTVRADQWQEFVEVYVRDKYDLGMKQYFEKTNPAALAQMMERMLEAARKNYWKPDQRTLRELAQRYRDLAARHDVQTSNEKFKAYVASAAQAGFGMERPAPAAAPSQSRPVPGSQELPPEPVDSPPQAVAETQKVSGMRLERQVEPASTETPVMLLLSLALLGVSVFGGALTQALSRATR